MKLKSIQKDLDDQVIVEEVAALAELNMQITSPYRKLMNSPTPYGAFPEYVKAIDSFFKSKTTSNPTDSPDVWKIFMLKI